MLTACFEISIGDINDKKFKLLNVLYKMQLADGLQISEVCMLNCFDQWIRLVI